MADPQVRSQKLRLSIVTGSGPCSRTSKVCYHALWPKTVIPFIGIIYNVGSQIRLLVVTDGVGCFLPAGLARRRKLGKWPDRPPAPPKLLGNKSRDRVGRTHSNTPRAKPTSSAAAASVPPCDGGRSGHDCPLGKLSNTKTILTVTTLKQF
jgi:hypothetical protein